MKTMPPEYLGRFENFAKFCEEAPEKAPCTTPYDERRDKIEKFRDSFSSVGPEIFAASIRSGIIFFLLTLGEACVSEIQFALNEPRQPLISSHLRELKEAGWVKGTRRGRWTCYSLTDEKLEGMSDLIELLREGQ